MKNTMKIKSLLSFFVPAAMMSLMVASCSDYDNGYDTNAIKFNEEFRKAYGDIDPEQDWNLAERGTVTVSTMKESEVKIYALRGDEYVIVGDYEGVKGTQMLGFDMVEGTTNIMVSDGETAVKTVSGGVVTFGGTRAAHIGRTGDVNVSKITDLNNGLTLSNNVNYPMYKEANEDDYEAMKQVIPEIGSRKTYTNLNKVTHDFTYVSNGQFIVYPYYWETSSLNEIGLYYKDGNNIKEVPIYTIKSGDEFQYATDVQVSEKSGDPSSYMTEGKNVSGNARLYWNYAGWYKALTWTETYGNVAGGDGSNLFGFSADDLKNATKLVIEGIDFQQQTKAFRVIFFSKDDASVRSVFTVYPKDVNDGKYEIQLSKVTSSVRNNCTVALAGGYGDDNPTNKFREYGGTGNEDVYGELRFTSIKLVTETAIQGWHSYTQNFCSEIYTENIGKKVRGQGIVVDIPEGRTFGMYLKKEDSSGSYTFYSQSELNEPSVVGNGVTDNGAGTVKNVPDMHPCYASTFYVGEQMFLGFEDWPNRADKSDFDLNDVVFAFDGCKPTIINEDPTPGGTWLLVCEDLGGSFDTDYNDVVFKVEHLSGQTFANVTAMAAGGTLASYIFFRDPTTASAPDQIIGEIHQMFNVAPAESGAYTPINVGYPSGTDRFQKRGNTVSIQVGKDWTMAYYQGDQFHQGDVGDYGENVNMGGFQIRTLGSGTPSPSAEVTRNGNDSFWNNNSQVSVIAAPDKGTAPYILCLPYSYKINEYKVNEGIKRNEYVWAWPLELCTICSSVYVQNNKYRDDNGGAYNKFGDWVRNYQNEKDWYKYRTNNNTVDPLLLSTEDIQQGGGDNPNAKLPNPLTNNGMLSLFIGEGTSLTSNLLNNVSGGALTWKFNYNGGTYSLTGIGQSPDNFKPTGAGAHTIIVEQAETDQYEAGSTSFILMVNQAQMLTCEVGGKKRILTYDNGGDKLILADNSYGAASKWLIEPSGNGEYYYLYNLGAHKYLSVQNGSGFPAKWVDTPDEMSLFMFLDDGRIHRYNAPERYLGFYIDQNNSFFIVDANAGAPKSSSTAITFTQEAQANPY
jgi:hypothetical protein